MKRAILEGAANPTLLLGTDPSPWNNANIENGRHAQEALDLATRASELWPAFDRSLREVVWQLGARHPASLDDVAALLAVLCDVHQFRECGQTHSNLAVQCSGATTAACTSRSSTRRAAA